MNAAIDYFYRESATPIGLAVAVDDFMKAWLRHGRSARFLCHTSDPKSFARFAEMARAFSKNAEKPCLQVDPSLGIDALRDVSSLFVPDPDLGNFVWRRARTGTSYATCGLVHSLSGDQVTKAVGRLCLAPTNGADALICPSRAIQSAVRRVFEGFESYLGHRFKTEVSCPVQTPIIPIGIDTDKFAARATPELRAAQRAALNVAEDEVVVLFVGRLNFATKAHPLPLLLSLRRAAQITRKKLRLVLFGYFMPADMSPRYEALARDFGAVENFRTDIVANDDPRFPHGLWAASDIFASLVDNIQESFGLVPIEAMACGLPSIVSDWDGYRDGVRHGLDGLLVPTLAPPARAGAAIAEKFFENRSYAHYLMGAAQSTAIDIDAAAKGFAALADNKEKRLEMGLQAMARARNVYDWRAIIPAYEQLWHKLAEERLHGSPTPPLPPGWDAVSPDFPNPWRIFESFASRTLSPEDKIKTIMSAQDIEILFRHDMNLFVPDLLLPVPLVRELAETLRETLWVREILAVAPESEKDRLWRTIGWLLKHGVCARQAS